MSGARLLEATLLALCCYLVANLATVDLTPAPREHAVETRGPQAVHQVDTRSRQVIVERNLFRVSTLLPPAPVVAAPAPEEEELAATRLPLRLLGTAASAGAAASYAAIEDQQSRKQRVVRAGETLLGTATVVRIERRRIVVQNGTVREELALDEEDKPAQLQVRQAAAARSSEVAAEAMRNRIQKLSETTFAKEPIEAPPSASRPLETQIAPRYELGQITGVALSAIERGSVFDELGIREGDTVTQVNGVVATNHQDSIALLRELTEASELQVIVIGADGAARTLSRSLGN